MIHAFVDFLYHMTFEVMASPLLQAPVPTPYDPLLSLPRIYVAWFYQKRFNASKLLIKSHYFLPFADEKTTDH